MRCFEFLVKGLSLPLIRVSLPALSRLTHLPAVLRETLCRQIKLALMAALPAFSGAALLADDLLVTVFGERWQLSVTVFQVLCVTGPLMVLERLAWTALTAIGKPAWMARTHLWTLAGTAAIAWYCAGYGLVAVAWIFVLRGLVLIPIISYLLRQAQALEFGAWLGQMGRVTLASFLVTGLAAAVQTPVMSSLGLLLGMPVIVLGSVLIYALLLKIIAPLQFREVVEVLALIRHGRLAHT
jgi:O-antigen/teichoic acid export membrane protein